jgi:hypothetical protein
VSTRKVLTTLSEHEEGEDVKNEYNGVMDRYKTAAYFLLKGAFPEFRVGQEKMQVNKNVVEILILTRYSWDQPVHSALCNRTP